VRIKLGLLLVAMTTLLIELLLIRIFDVILTPNLGYMVISTALLSLGLGGIYRAIRPLPAERNVNRILAGLATFFGLSTLAILPAFNILPFDFYEIPQEPVSQSLYLIGMYLCLAFPFFFAGLIFTTVFSEFSDRIQILYCWDLVGAGLGAVILIPFLPKIGPGGTLFIAAAVALVASALFSGSRRWGGTVCAGAAMLILIPMMHYPDIYDFKEHLEKRGPTTPRENEKIEFTRWDTISKIDVVDPGLLHEAPKKRIQYDGGSQSSDIFQFNGDLQELRHQVETGQFVDWQKRPWWQWGVLASHYLKRDQGQMVLIIGSAGGQETKAALMYGAGSIDAIELVGTVIELGKDRYATYNGGIFNHPNVNARKAEGRSFLRSTKNKYDIIQIFSNHTSSSIAAGSSAMGASYLQTADAFQEYFSHLTKDGILHMNHHIYPKLVTTAALAWSRMGRKDFQKHVVVFNLRGGWDNLPTLLIKMTPWTQNDIQELFTLIKMFDDKDSYELAEDPINPDNSFLSPEFYSGKMSQSLIDSIPYRVEASTDDKPYFNFLRKKIGLIEPDSRVYLNEPTANLINSQIHRGIPMDIIHLIVTSVLGILAVLVFIFLPLLFSRVGRAEWPWKYTTLAYFSCLGAGFIIIELAFTQIFMKLVGYPLYAFSTVIFALLVSSAVGSVYSFKLGISPEKRWAVPFLGVLITGFCLYTVYPHVFNMGLELPVLGRIAVTFALIFPLGFFLGMPFPLGILAIRQMPRGAVAWAWSMNGLFTVVGGVGSVLLSIFFGFKNSLLVAFAIYAAAFYCFAMLRSTAPSGVELPLKATKWAVP
jgi:spermidine synthase